MRPTSLVVRGLKCWDDRTLDLPPLLAIQGPNGSGKTALIQAIRLALLGYDPETGKQLNQTRKLLAPNVAEAEIGLSFDTGFGIRRRFGEKSDTQVLPPRGERNGRECQERINEETGGLVVSLDLGEFLDLSDEKRRGWLFEHLPPDAAELTWETFAEWTDGEEGALKGVVSTLWKTCVKTAPNAVVGLGSAIEVAHRDYLEADRDRLNQIKVVGRGVEVERTLEKPGPVEPGALKVLQERRGSVDQRIGTARAGAEARESIEMRRFNAKGKLGAAMRELEHTETVRADQVAQLESLPGLEETAPLEAELEGLESDADLARHTHVAAGEETVKVDGVRARLFGRRDALVETERQGCQFAALGCTTDTKGLVVGKLEDIDGEIEEIEKTLGDLRTTEADARKALAELLDDASYASHKLTDARKANAHRTELEHAAEHKLTVMTELRERCGIYRTAMEEAESELVQDDDAAGPMLRKLYDDRDAIDEEILTLQGQLDAGVRYETTLEGLKREEAVLEERSENATALKELDGNLRRLRGHVIQLMIEPLESAANEVLYAMDPEKRFRFIFERENKAILDFGFEENGVLRLFAAASKGERVMLAVSFLGALLKVMAPPMRLLVIDDVEQLDPGRRARLMNGLATLSDRWDTVLIAGACDFEAVDGWVLEVLGEVMDSGKAYLA